VAELYVVSNYLLPCLDRQVAVDAVRFEMIFFTDNEIATSLLGNDQCEPPGLEVR
jgi:hypothetical protein